VVNLSKFKVKDRIIVNKDFPDDYIWDGDIGTVVNVIGNGKYSVFLDDDESDFPVMLYDNDMDFYNEEAFRLDDEFKRIT